MQFVIRLESKIFGFFWVQWMVGACPFTNSGIERSEVVSYFLPITAEPKDTLLLDFSVKSFA
jgi:hypothetical protein